MADADRIAARVVLQAEHLWSAGLLEWYRSSTRRQSTNDRRRPALPPRARTVDAVFYTFLPWNNTEQRSLNIFRAGI